MDPSARDQIKPSVSGRTSRSSFDHRGGCVLLIFNTTRLRFFRSPSHWVPAVINEAPPGSVRKR